jgi:hypothetical protein
MTLKRILIGCGTLIIVGMLVVAAFALGVYVGEHGWTRAALQFQPGAGQMPRGQPPGAGPGSPPRGGTPPGFQLPPGLPPGQPQVVGRIRQIGAADLILATKDGPRQVMLTDETQYQDIKGNALTLSDLAERDIIAVFGSFVPGDGQQLQAEVVVRLPQQR